MSLSPQPLLAPWRPVILWDVLEEHLSEAAFLWRMWEHSLRAHDFTLEDVAEGDEPRLLAHLEGLVIGGQPAARRLLLPALDSEEVTTLCAAASALLAARDSDWLDSLPGCLTEGNEALLQGCLRALELSERPDVSSALLQRLPQLDSSLQARVLDALRFRRTDPGGILTALDRDDTVLFAAAVRAARFAPRPLAAELVRYALAAADEAVHAAAMETGLLLGLRAAWTRCRQSFEQDSVERRLALLALAVSGDRHDLDTVMAGLAAPELHQEALWALGFSGRLTAADALLAVLREEPGRLAAGSFALITGLPLKPPFLSADDTDDEDVTPVEESPDAALPAPAAPGGRVEMPAVERWWADARRRFEPEGRYLLGRRFGPEALLSALETAPMRRRPALALELAIRSGGTCLVEPRDWTARQRRQAHALCHVPPRVLALPFDAVLTG